MSLIQDVIGGTIGIVGGVGGVIVGYVTLQYSKKKDKAENQEEEATQNTVEAVALASAVTDIQWIKQQMGKNPNGGNAMEQLLNHAKAQNVSLNTTNELVSSLTNTIQQHLNWHIATDRK